MMKNGDYFIIIICEGTLMVAALFNIWIFAN